jgi:hypothetical protein
MSKKKTTLRSKLAGSMNNFAVRNISSGKRMAGSGLKMSPKPKSLVR